MNIAEWARFAHLGHILVRQDIESRYRGTLLGRAWPLVMPLAMLAVYGFVFGVVFRARWPGVDENDHAGFTLNLFAGLLIHGLMAESLGQAPGLMLRHQNFVRKVVFPLSVLVGVPLGAALFHGAVALTLLVLANGVSGGGWHATALLTPVLLVPYVILLYGLCLLFAALGVYLRDLAQVTGLFITFALFTGAVFYPRDMVPEALAGVVDLNPITWPVETVRLAVLQGQLPEPGGAAAYSVASLLVLTAGAYFFRVLRRGFADVL